MRRGRFALVTVFLCLLPIGTYAQEKPSDAEIKAAMAKLYDGKDDSGFAPLEILYKNPRRSAEILIASLKPVRRGQYVGGNHPQVVWNIRALRSLTGIDFRAHTHADLTEDEAHFLGHHPETDDGRHCESSTAAA